MIGKVASWKKSISSNNKTFFRIEFEGETKPAFCWINFMPEGFGSGAEIEFDEKITTQDDKSFRNISNVKILKPQEEEEPEYATQEDLKELRGWIEEKFKTLFEKPKSDSTAGQ